MTITRDEHKYILEALVVENLDVDILAGVPFMEVNDVTVRPALREITFKVDTVYQYGPNRKNQGSHAIRRTHAHLLHAPSSDTTVWPGTSSRCKCRNRSIAMLVLPWSHESIPLVP